MFSRQQSAGALVLHVGGEIDISNAERFDEAVTALIAAAEPDQRLVVTFTMESFCDSTALSVLIKHRHTVGGRMDIVAPEGSVVKKVLDVTNLSSQFDVYHDLESALAAYPTGTA